MQRAEAQEVGDGVSVLGSEYRASKTSVQSTPSLVPSRALSRASSRAPSRARPAFTTLELLVALAVSAALTLGAIATLRAHLDRLAVRQAIITLQGAFAHARRAAIDRGGATIHIASTGAHITAHDSTLVQHDLQRTYHVTVRTTTGAMSFGPTGLGRGIANGTIIVSRGRAADTLVVSRLGRVRY